MTDLRKAAEMALEALEMTKVVFKVDDRDYGLSRVSNAAEALRQALAQPEQEAIKQAYIDGLNNGIEAEREACARVCDEALLQLNETANQLEESEYLEQCAIQGAMTQAVKLAKAIRARGEK